MKNFISILFISALLSGCGRSACDCLEEQKELSRQGSSALSTGNRNALEDVIEEKADLDKECEKYTQDDYNKCK
jgi:hypothetical protein